MAQTATKPTERTNDLDSERDALRQQLRVLSGDEPAPAQASVTPEAGDHAPAEDPESVSEGKQEGEPSTETREAKEEKRKSKTWAELNREKNELAAQRRELDAMKAEVARMREEAEEKASTAGRYTPEDYEAAAMDFEKNDDHENAERARKEAKRLRTESAAAEQKRQRRKLEADWQAEKDRVLRDNPELEDRESEFRKTFEAVLKERPNLATYVGGLTEAASFTKVKMKADESERLTRELEETKAKLAKYEKKLQPGGGTAPLPEAGDKSFDELSLDKQSAALRAVIRRMEREGRPASDLF